MLIRLRQLARRLYADESGAVIVFVLVFMVALLVFMLSLMNLGHITTEKIKLQNAADFSALTTATWQARAMNMQGLFNTTITAGIVMHVARSLVTGLAVSPEGGEFPPDWIRLQQSAQEWLRQSFNEFNYASDDPHFSGENVGFGSWMAHLTGRINGDFITTTYPEPAPLYVYRYRFFDANYDVNPAVGAMHFVDIAQDKDYIPRPMPQRNPYYQTPEVFASAPENYPDTPAGSGYVRWENEMRYSNARNPNDAIWPKPNDSVRVFSGGSGNMTSDNLSYNLLRDLNLENNPAEQRRLLNSLRYAIDEMIIDYGATDVVSDYNIVTILQDHVRDILIDIEPGSSEFVALFTHPTPLNNALELPDSENQSAIPTAHNNVSGHLFIRISVESNVGVFPEAARVGLIHGDFNRDDPAPVTWTPREMTHSINRYYDTKAKHEFWDEDLKTTQFLWNLKDQRAVDKPFTTETGTTWVFSHYEYQYEIKCPICPNYTKPTGWITKNSLSNSDCLAYMGSRHRYHSPYGNHKEDCIQRRWWYYAFGVEFKITVKAYMNLDFSTLLMAKCSFETDPKQLDRAGNESVRDLYSSHFPVYYRSIITSSLCPSQDILFGKPFFANFVPKSPPAELTEYQEYVRDAVVPSMEAEGAATHEWAGELYSDRTTGGTSDLFFGMSWFSMPALYVDEGMN